MVSIIQIGSGSGSGSMKNIALILLTAGIGYLLWKNYFQAGNGSTDKAGGGSAPSPADILGDTVGTLYQGAIDQGSGLQIPTLPDPNWDLFGGITENIWNFATGVAKANPFTAPVMTIYDVTSGWINDWLSGSVKLAETAKTTSTPFTPAPTPKETILRSTKMTTPTIPEYTTKYEKEIKESVSIPTKVKSKILAGKIW